MSGLVDASTTMAVAGLSLTAIVLALAMLPLVAVARRLAGWRAAHAVSALCLALALAAVDPVLGVAAPVVALVNYAAGRAILARRALGLAVVWPTALAILATIGACLAIRAAAAPAGAAAVWTVLAPLGLSFFALSQIGWLLDCAAQRVRAAAPERHALCALLPALFPVGPVTAHADVERQLAAQGDTRDGLLSAGRMAVCLTFCGAGLVKTVAIAGLLAPYAAAGLDTATAGAGTLWLAALAFTLMLYFALSGLSDVVVGLAFLFGVRAPLNFDAPLRAASIAGFWNGWMMSVTRFLGEHLRGPMALAGARVAPAGGRARWLLAGAAPLIVAFAVMGLWLGPTATSLGFGLAHGAALAINHGWRRSGLRSPGRLVGWAMTTAVVVAAMVLLRVPTLDEALAQWAVMAGVAGRAGGVMAGWPAALDMAGGVTVIGGAWAVALLAPSMASVMRAYWVSGDAQPPRRAGLWSALQWRPSAGWAAAAAAALLLAVTATDDPALLALAVF